MSVLGFRTNTIIPHTLSYSNLHMLIPFIPVCSQPNKKAHGICGCVNEFVWKRQCVKLLGYCTSGISTRERVERAEDA